jgi:cell wall assembly regulator SMI1
MSIVDKFRKLIEWQKDAPGELPAELSQQITEEEINTIEALLGEQVPQAFREMYTYANGQTQGNAVMFGHGFLNAQQIIKQLQDSKDFVKPAEPFIENPEKSKALLDKIVAFYVEHTPTRNMLGIKQKWYKIEFACSPSSYEGPYLYKSENTTEENRETITIKNYKEVEELVDEIYYLEKRTYNWDTLQFKVFANGTYEVERTYYNFNDTIPFTSTPKDSIKRIYYHHKWLPLFEDYGGNYIGIDLDPDVNGTKGQIINFGRDEEDMFVFADDLESFFDLILNEIEVNGGKAFKHVHHLHDVIKEIKYPGK